MKALITDYEFPHVENEKNVFREAGVDMAIAQCRTPEDVIAHGREANALLVQWAPINRQVLAELKNCKVIVRYGIGYDNVDVTAAAERGIAVCNVPDYATGEVADHAMSLALALGRQLPFVDRRLRGGTWNIVPDRPMPSFRDMWFVALGFGRIARGVIQRAQAFGFKTAAYDPFVPVETFKEAGVESLSQAEAFARADILSLHLPINAETKHVVNAESLKKMKKSATLINTSRGGLVDTKALVAALTDGTLFAAGLDVFETEPLEKNHPILSCPNTLLTSHMAWHSSSSVTCLQIMAAEEAVRGLRGQPLRSQVNTKR
jgi:D-3-phosphoglycerate dehydrogenase / 2-oxoglutarate reductase